MRKSRRKSTFGKTRRRLALFSLLIFLVSGADLLFFHKRVSDLRIPTDITADAVIVLTGGAGRIGTGNRLVSEGMAEVLFISGVHVDVTLQDIEAVAGGDSAVYACCTILERKAGTTLGNARVTANWVHSQGYDEVIVVTSDYHMPRSMLLLSQAMPNIKITPYPVRLSRSVESNQRKWKMLWNEWVKWRTMTVYYLFG